MSNGRPVDVSRGGGRGQSTRGRGGGRGQSTRGRGGGRGQSTRGRGGGRGQSTRGRGGGRGQSTRGRGRGRGGGRGQAGRGQSGGRGQSSHGQSSNKRKTTFTDSLPTSAQSTIVIDSGVQHLDDFFPLQQPGPHVPESEISAILLFELFFNDDALERIVQCSLEYAESKKDPKRKLYNIFMKKRLNREELMAFIGAPIHLGIHHVRNHRKAWGTRKAQLIVRLRDLLTCQRFEIIGTFLHVVTVEEEEEMEGDPFANCYPHQDEMF